MCWLWALSTHEEPLAIRDPRRSRNPDATRPATGAGRQDNKRPPMHEYAALIVEKKYMYTHAHTCMLIQIKRQIDRGQPGRYVYCTNLHIVLVPK